MFELTQREKQLVKTVQRYQDKGLSWEDVARYHFGTDAPGLFRLIQDAIRDMVNRYEASKLS